MRSALSPVFLAAARYSPRTESPPMSRTGWILIALLAVFAFAWILDIITKASRRPRH